MNYKEYINNTDLKDKSIEEELNNEALQNEALQNEEWAAMEKFHPQGVFSFYTPATQSDQREIEKETREKGEKHLGERFTYTSTNKLIMWSADLQHDQALKFLKKKYPQETFIANITFDKTNNEFWSSTKGWYDTLPETIKEKLLRIHPEATFEAS